MPDGGKLPFAPAYAIVVAEWRRNSRELVRIAIDRYNGRETVDVRSWWLDPKDDTYKPGRSGLTLAIGHLENLAAGLATALQQAWDLGLIEAPINNTTKDRTAAERQRRRRARLNSSGAVTERDSP
jgi:hypothetical protein